MIVREYVDNTEMAFDFFNDFRDTRNYLKAMKASEADSELYDKALDRLEDRYMEYIKNK